MRFRVFYIPLLLSFSTVAGLVSALLGDGMWDAFSWLALLMPPAAAAFFSLQPRKNHQS